MKRRLNGLTLMPAHSERHFAKGQLHVLTEEQTFGSGRNRCPLGQHRLSQDRPVIDTILDISGDRQRFLFRQIDGLELQRTTMTNQDRVTRLRLGNGSSEISVLSRSNTYDQRLSRDCWCRCRFWNCRSQSGHNRHCGRRLGSSHQCGRIGIVICRHRLNRNRLSRSCG